MRKNIIKEKSFDFALNIIQLSKDLSNNKKEYVLSKQVLRSGTSIGAMVMESEYAESKRDFIHKLSVSLKEASETMYWLELLYHSNYMEADSYVKLKTENEELLKILISIVRKSKENSE
jgi:four helix bundle protein